MCHKVLFFPPPHQLLLKIYKGPNFTLDLSIFPLSVVNMILPRKIALSGVRYLDAHTQVP